MAGREIVKYPDPVLRERAKNISKVNPGVRKLVKDMIATMHETCGLGLAANQVGVLQRIFVYDDGTGPGVVINPKVVRASGEQMGVEGCLSVPGLQGEVKRAEQVVVKGTDLSGKTVKIKTEGLLARVFQHEMDHLNGTLFIDRAEPDSLYCVTEEEQRQA
ncbi:MAG TPA: peptide deformylase [Armatimonadota bacterium]|nr:peptide deformylase [Armatimonadota bacterium]